MWVYQLSLLNESRICDLNNTRLFIACMSVGPLSDSAHLN